MIIIIYYGMKMKIMFLECLNIFKLNKRERKKVQ